MNWLLLALQVFDHSLAMMIEDIKLLSRRTHCHNLLGPI
jgi:hypothetical protein